MPTLETIVSEPLIEEKLTSRVLEDKPLTETGDSIKRIATLDFFRGFSIVFMIAFHVFMKMYDYEYLMSLTSMPDLPLFVVILMGIAAFFGTWHAFFMFISCIVNSYVLMKKAQKGNTSIRIILEQITVGVILIILGWFEQSFGYFGYFGDLIAGSGSWTDFSWLYVQLFQPEPIQMIGVSLILNGIILYFMTRKNGHEKYRRNMLIYFSGIIVVAISTILLTTIGPDYLPYFSSVSYQNIVDAIATFGSFKAWLIAITIGGIEPLFPFMITMFAGAMIGLTLAKPNVKRRATLWGIFIGLGIFVVGILYTVLNIKLGLRWTVMDRNASFSTYLMRLGFQVLTINFFLNLIEFRGRGEKFANRSIVKFFRFWGIISLTVYLLQLFEYFPRWLLTIVFRRMTGLNFLDHNIITQGSELLLLFVAIFTIVWFYILQKIWSKIHYVGTFEWFILKIRYWIFKSKRSRLDADTLLNKVRWINFSKVAIP